MAGQEVSFAANQAMVPACWAPASEPDAPGILVLHAWWGLNTFFKRFCDRLAEAGFSALAPSLFDGKTAVTIPEAEALVQEFEQGKPDQVQVTALAALAELRQRVPKRKLGVIGFSFGAAWACALAVSRPDEVGKVTLVYGLYDPGLANVKADFLGHFAEHDPYAEPMEYARSGEAHIREAGRQVTFHVYPGTAHWFLEDDRPEYDAQAARLAWDRTVAFFKELA